LNLLTQNQINNDELLSQLSKLYTTNAALKSYLVKKLNQGIFAQIEIWMTDLCMEPEAEAKCNELIDFSLGLDKENPETFSLLASIRISQQRNDEAKESLIQSWNLFQQKKAQLEQAANSIRNAENNENNENNDAFEVGVEYVELIQPLLTLSKFAIELEQYETAATITSNIQDINENILDTYYYEALSYLFAAKYLYHQAQNPKIEDYRDVDNKELLKSSNVEVANKVKEAKSSLTNGYKIINSDAVETADPELVEQVNALLSELGGPVMSELMQARNEDETGWEDEIHSDNE
jgi:tetratricopeptide (TPR) repeat protein